MIQTPGRADAEALDRADPLAAYRDRFALPPDICYLDGNSLGALPGGVAEAVAETVEQQWGVGLVRSWNDPWVDIPARVAGRIAGLLGADPAAVTVADSVSVNLFKALAASCLLRPGRSTILCDGGEFPTDLYVADGLARLLGERARVRLIDDGDFEVPLRDGADVAVVLASHVSFRTGAMRDLGRLVAAAHRAGALFVVDLSHSAGVVDLDLASSGVDFAVGCGYKYLNGGPGAPSFLYVAPAHHEAARTPIQGWIGHADFFAFEPTYRPAAGAARFQGGTWPILSLVALDAALAVFDGVSMAAVRAKSVALGELFLARVAPWLAPELSRLASPRRPERRGSQLAFHHDDGYAVVQALIERGVIGDFRTPDVIRFGFAPLYLRYVDVFDAAEAFVEVVRTRAWDAPRFRERGAVT